MAVMLSQVAEWVTDQLMEKQGFTDKMKWDSSKGGKQATYDAYYFGNERVNLKVQKLPI